MTLRCHGGELTQWLLSAQTEKAMMKGRVEKKEELLQELKEQVG